MSPILELGARILVDWCVIAVIVGGAYALAMGRRNRRRATPDPVFRIVSMYPPALSAPVTQADDADWLSAWPSSVDDVDELDRQFFAIVDRETRWFADGAA